MKASTWRAWSKRILSRDRRWVICVVGPFLLLALVFTFLIRTSDPANVSTFQYASSFLVLSLNPYNALQFPPPPNYFSFLLPSFWAYETHWQVYDTTTVLKLYSIVATLLLGGLVYKIAFRYTNSGSKSQAAFLAILASPFLFYVSFMEAGQDVIGLVFAVAGLYYLIPLTNSKRLSTTDLVLGSGLLVYGMFLYYFPLIVIWSLFVFSKNRKKAIFFGVSVAAWTCFFYLAYAYGGLWQFLPNISGATQATKLVPVYSILNLATPGLNSPWTAFTPFTAELSLCMLICCLVSVLILPVLLRYAKRSILLSLATTMALPFLFAKIYNGDEMVWVLPFVALFLVTRLQEKRIGLWLLVSQCWLLPQIFVLNMWIAPGYGAGTGVFYFTYLQFHNPTVVYTLFPQPYALSKLLDLTTFLSLSWMVVVMIWLSQTRPSVRPLEVWNLSSRPVPNPNDSTRLQGADVHGWRRQSGSGQNPSQPILLRSVRSLSRSLSFYAVLVLVGLSAIAVVPVAHNAQISYSGTDSFPLGLFRINPIQNPSLTYSFSENGVVLEISNGTGPAGPFPASFDRNLSGQTLTASFEMSVPNLMNATFVDPVAHLGSAVVNYVGRALLPTNASPINPFREENVTGYTAAVPITRSPPIGLWNLSGYSIQQYSINLSEFQFDSLAMFFNPTPVSYGQNLLFYSQLSNESQELFILGGTLYFGVQSLGMPWTYYPESTPDGPFSWHSFLFNVQPTQLTFEIDGRIIHVTPTTPNSSMQLDVGAFLPGSHFYHRYAFTGVSSELLSVPTAQIGYSPAIEVGQANVSGETDLRVISMDSGNWSVAYSGQALTLGGNTGVNSGGSNGSLFSFGRYSSESPALNVQIHNLTLASTESDGILERVVVISIGSPIVLFIMWIDRSTHRARLHLF